MSYVNSCSLKLLLDRVKEHELGIYEIIMEFMDFNLLLFSLCNIKFEIEHSSLRFYYYEPKENIQLNLVIFQFNNQKIITIGERVYFVNYFVHSEFVNDVLDIKTYEEFKDDYFDDRLRNTNVKEYFILLINSFLNISYSYSFKNIMKISNKLNNEKKEKKEIKEKKEKKEN